MEKLALYPKSEFVALLKSFRVLCRVSVYTVKKVPDPVYISFKVNWAQGCCQL